MLLVAEKGGVCGVASQSVLLGGAGDGGDEGDPGGEGRLERGASHRGLCPCGADVSVAGECDSIEAMCLSVVCTLSSSTCMTIPLVTR